MDLSKLSKTELEALAYQQVKLLTQTQNNLQIIEQAIADYKEPEIQEVAEDIGEPVKEKK
jgi:hypothetical protein